MPIRLTVVLCFYMRCRFSRAYLFGRARARNSQLPACRRCRLRACVSPTTTQARGTSALWCHGTDVGGVSLAAAWGSVARRKEHAIGRRKYFLLCELAIATRNKPQTTTGPSTLRMSFLSFFVLLSCLASSCSCILTSSCFASTYCSFIESNRHISAATPPPAPQVYRTTAMIKPAAADASLSIHATGIIS